MSELKCPFCQQELQEDIGYDGDYSCPNCKEPYFGSPELWQELIRTRKALEKAKSVLTDLRDYARLDGIQERYTEEALSEIKTALEQKDVK